MMVILAIWWIKSLRFLWTLVDKVTLPSLDSDWVEQAKLTLVDS